MSGNGPFDEPEIPVDGQLLDDLENQLDEPVAEQLETTLREQQIELGNLQQELVSVRSERNILQQEVERLTETVADLETELDRTTAPEGFEMAEVFHQFGGAFEHAQQRLGDEDLGYELGNVHVNLRASVVGDEEGVKFHFPADSERIDPGTVSEFDFDLRPRSRPDETEFEEIPSVVGRDYETASRMIADRGFESEIVERQSGSDPDVVREQFPSARSLAEPGTVIDLVVTESTAPEGEGNSDDEEEEPDTDDTEDGDGNESDSTTDENEEETDDGGPTEASRRLQAIRGIGPNYANRLRDAGIEGVEELAEADARRVADATGASAPRADQWIERAQNALESDEE